jgi:hypothetical protein
MLNSNSRSKIILAIIVIVIIVLGALLLMTSPSKAPVSEPAANTEGTLTGQVVSPGENEPTSKRASLSGTFVCLPHKDKTGPQTAECAFGMKASDGSYYALDFNMSSQPIPTMKVGDKFEASGLLTPLEALSSDHMRIYDIKGIFSITDSFKRL